MDISKQKEAVGEFAANLVKDEDIIGMGTGSTVAFFAKALGQRIKNGENFHAIPTSYQSIGLCNENNIKITSLNEHIPEKAFDGADEVNNNNQLIKGRGGAMTQEKIIDYNAREFYVLIDQDKIVDVLGKKFPVPIEVIPLAIKTVMNTLLKIGKPKIREAKYKDGPIITDNGNFIVDLKIIVNNPIELENKLNNIPGVVENGIFTKECKIIYPINNDVINIR